MYSISIQDYSKIAGALGQTSSPRLAKVLINALQVGRNHVIVDVGGGTGGDARIIVEKTGVCVLVIDRSFEMLEIGSGSISRIQGDALRLPIRSWTIDGAYFVNILQVVSNHSLLLTEIRRILKPKGRLAFPVTSHNQLQSRFINRFFPSLPAIESARYPRVSELARLLRSVGFTGIRTTEADLGHFVVDHTYLNRLRSGIFSGLFHLDEAERDEGFHKLEHWISQSASRCNYTVVPRIRTLVTAKSGIL